MDLRDTFQYVYLMFNRLNQDQLYDARIESIVQKEKDERKMYKTLINLNPSKNRIFIEEFELLPYVPNAPIYIKGFGKQYHKITMRYVPEETTFHGNKIYSLPKPNDISEVVDMMKAYALINKPNLNPINSPVVPILMGPNYYCVFTAIRIPLELDFESVIDIAKRKDENDSRFLTKDEMDRIEKMYMEIGVFLRIFEYLERIDYIEDV